MREQAGLFEATIDNFSHDGRGIARIEGKTTFISGALPGERVSFTYTRRKSDYDEGIAQTILEPASLRTEPACAHYAICGGCALQHIQEGEQIHLKQKLLSDILQRLGHVQPESWLAPLSASSWHYRHKARLSVRYVEKKGGALVGFREKRNPRYIADIDSCLILEKQIGLEIQALKQLIGRLVKPAIIAQIEVAVGEDAPVLIFRNLETLAEEDEAQLKHFAQEKKCIIYLQPKGPDSIIPLYPANTKPYLQYSLPEEGLIFQFAPTDFTQVNPQLNRIMIKQALGLMDLNPEDKVLDLFCGLGNFSLPMAKKAGLVLGIEGCQEMVERAYMNAQLNAINNVQFLCADLDSESLQTLLKDNFNKVLLDPPRSGALAIVKKIDLLAPERIVYVSCNPATLARDSHILVHEHGYKMRAAGAMDMFPHTTHVEAIVLFERG